jgi:hypothetical protein
MIDEYLKSIAQSLKMLTYLVAALIGAIIGASIAT